MDKTKLKTQIHSIDFAAAGTQMYQLVSELYPICRSITGNGVRETLNSIKSIIPLEVKEVPSGTTVFDWEVPKEWNIEDAWIKNSEGEKIVDFKKSNLHVLNYSAPISKTVDLNELKAHLFTLPDHPDWIPYRTSYYQQNWGFCIPHNQFDGLKEESYDVLIDSSLTDGFLTFGEFYLKGASSDEVLISTHICHPSLCNDNLSGIALSAILGEHLSKVVLEYSYRFLFIPGTIGSITWLALNKKSASKIKHGLVLACVGDSGNFTYKKTRIGRTEIDEVMMYALKNSARDFKVIDFFPYGYDERQYCSPGFNLPVGCLMRTPHGQYPEYHTSADNLKFVKPENLSASLELLLNVLNIVEQNKKYLNQNPMCEPHLGKRSLYQHIGGHADSEKIQLALLWTLNMSDGQNSLLDISLRSGLDFGLISEAADILVEKNLLKEHKTLSK
jgi:aminopeptidase-like protein